MFASPIHALPEQEALAALETGPMGLQTAEARSRLDLYGLNAIREPARPEAWREAVPYFTHGMALLLWLAGALALISGHIGLGLAMWLVVVSNGAFSFWQEFRARRATATLKSLLPAVARVVRDGVDQKLPSSELVPGDVLILAEGDNVPADARVIEAFGLRLNQATLTGESMPVQKTSDASLRDGLSELERPNLVFAGTTVHAGTGRAVVFATGMLTQFGRIANLTQSVPEEPSPLQRDLARVTRRGSLIALILGAVVFAEAWIDLGGTWLQSFTLAIGLIVAVIPEGLTPTVTLSLARAVQRLASQGVLVKRLATIEALGATSVICTDKSGTLTQNQMTVRSLWVGRHLLEVSGVGYAPVGEIAGTRSHLATPEVEVLLTAALLCNNARLIPPTPEHPGWSCLGDQTEAALRAVALKGGLDEGTVARRWPRIHELPFDARRKRMSTIHRHPGGETAFIKGAPKEVLQLCTTWLFDGMPQPLTDAIRDEILAANDAYARRAMRVLALARRELPPRAGAYSPEGVERSLTFLGLAAMMDPPRPEVAAAVQTCHEAGIRLVMITGDYGLTAESIARRVGLLKSATPRILTGAEVETLSDDELAEIMSGEVIGARMAPEHKLRVVAALQARGEVVVVTGDGVNDAPALRKADIGVAMGVTGTDVAKEAADVVLTNDRFDLLTVAIAEGRAVIDNLRKFATYIFASNVPEFLPFVLTAMFRIPLALTTMQVLAIDLGTDLLPALALGLERPEPDVMRRPPRRRDKPLIDRGLMLRALLWLGPIEAALCYLGFYSVYLRAGLSTLPLVNWVPFAERLTTHEGRLYLLATTTFHVGVVMAQIGNAFTCRTETEQVHRLGWLSNRYLILGILAEVFLIISFVYVPPLAALLEHVPLPTETWVGLCLFGPIVYGIDRVRKSLVRRRNRVHAAPRRTTGEAHI